MQSSIVEIFEFALLTTRSVFFLVDPFAAILEKPEFAFFLRLMGLILVAIAVQFIVNGASGLGAVYLDQK